MPILIDATRCLDKCTICDVFCPGDIIYREAKYEPPVVKYQEECWYCGACALHCPVGAVQVIFPPAMLHCDTDIKYLIRPKEASVHESTRRRRS